MSINNLPFPAAILDENFKVKQRNRLCRVLSVNELIKKRVSRRDFLRLSALKNGEECDITLRGDELLSAFAVRNEESVLMIGIHPVAVDMQKRVDELTGMQLRLSEILQPYSDEQARKHAEKLQDRLKEFLEIINGQKNDTTAVYDLSTSPLVRAVSGLIAMRGRRAEVYIGESAIPVRINLKDFNRVACIMIGDAFVYGEEADIEIQLKTYERMAYFLVRTTGSVPENFESMPFDGKNGERIFSLNLAKILCKYYGWDFSVKRDGNDDGTIIYSLGVPLTTDQMGLTVNACPDGESEIEQIYRELFD